VVGRASALLGARGAALAALAAVLAGYYAAVGRLWEWPLWGDIAWLSVVLIPAVFLLVWLALPAWSTRGLLLLALACGAIAAAFAHADYGIPANFAKLAAMTFFAWWFLAFFESLSWVVLVAAIIPFVDTYSVWKGPTHHIVEQKQGLFATLSIAFPVPGGHGAAQLGLPDLLFFALFLAASVRFRLRPFWTWLAMTASFGTTMALAIWLDVNGLPALPLLSVGFLAPNADLIVRRLRKA